MSEEKIIDYSRQTNVNRAYVIIVLLFIIGGVWILNYFEHSLKLIIVDLIFPGVLFITSLIMGYGSKKAIDYVPGEWEKRKTWVSFSEYEEMVDKYEEAYGELFANPTDCFVYFCMLLFVIVTTVLTYLFHEYEMVLINSLFDSILIIVFLYVLISVLAFVIGFRVPNIDSDEFFKPPVTGDTYQFASQLYVYDCGLR